MGLYIKLDKKLFVEAKSITFSKESNHNSSVKSMDYIFNEIPFILQFFDTILIDKISYNDLNAKVIFQDDKFFIDNNFVVFDTKLESYKDGDISFQVNNIFLKDYDISISGNLNGNIEKDNYFFTGNYSVPGITGFISLNYDNSLLNYYLKSDNFSSLEPFMKRLESHVNINQDAANWIYKFIVASDYEIKYLNGKFDIETGNFFPFEMRGFATSKNVNITIHEEVPQIFVKDLNIQLSKNELSFSPKNVTYQNTSLHSSDVHINNLTNENRAIKINMRTKSYLDGGLHKILKAFGIYFPISQISGTNDGYLGIDIKLSNFDVNIFGNFSIKNADINVSGTKMFLKESTILLDNYIINLKNSTLDFNDIFSGTIFDAKLDMKKKIMETDLFINYLLIDNIIYVKNIQTPLYFEILENNVLFDFQDFESKIYFSNSMNMDFKNLSKLEKYSSFMKSNKIYNGTAQITTNDFESFFGAINITKAQLPIIENDNVLTSISGNFSASKDLVWFYSSDKKIELKFGKESNLTFNDLSIIYDENRSKDSDSNKPINLSLKNGKIILSPSNTTILADNILMKQKKDFLSVDILYKNGTLNLLEKNNNFTLNAKSLDSDFVNALLNKNFFVNGEISVIFSGENIDNFFGTIKVENTNLKDFNTLNNLAAFFNTIPALATLNNPKYSTDGYPVKSGKMDFIRMEHLIYISDIHLQGYSIDLDGAGYIDLNADEIYLELKISTLKSISQIIDYIPLVNFIVLGDDGTISISVSIRGKLSDPKVHTNVLGETVLSPFNMIKRLFQLPGHILN